MPAEYQQKQITIVKREKTIEIPIESVRNIVILLYADWIQPVDYTFVII